MKNHDIETLDKKGLREFGLVPGAILAGLFGLVFPWFFNAVIPAWPWVIGIVLVMWALIAPLSLEPLYRNWMKIGQFMGTITTPLILGILYFALFVPGALILKAMGKDPMSRKLDKEAITYRIVSTQHQKNDMENPF